MNSIIFTKAWVESIRNLGPDEDNPNVYTFVIADHLQQERENMEFWISQIPVISQKRLIKRIHKQIRKVGQILDVYNELMFGNAFVQLGYQIEYEKKLSGNLTPDWFVYPRNTTETPFIMEAKTRNISDADFAYWVQLRKLANLLTQIRLDMNVTLTLTLENNFSSIHAFATAISDKVKNWLANITPQVGDNKSFDGMKVEITTCDLGSSSMHVIFPMRSFSVNPKPIECDLLEKGNKYAPLDIPLVVALATDFLTAYDSEDIEEVLLGEKASYSSEDGDSVHIQLDNGVGRDVPSLSSVIWSKSVSVISELCVVDNPHAAKPLPKSTWLKRA